MTFTALQAIEQNRKFDASGRRRRPLGEGDKDALILRYEHGKATHIVYPPAELEGDLHDEIMDDLRALGWPYAHNRMDKKSTAGNGVTDFIIAASGGRTFWIECKARNRKRSPEQQAFADQLERFGHKAHLCKSIAEFKEIVR